MLKFNTTYSLVVYRYLALPARPGLALVNMAGSRSSRRLPFVLNSRWARSSRVLHDNR